MCIRDSVGPQHQVRKVKCPQCRAITPYRVVPGEDGDLIPDDHIAKMDNAKIPLAQRKPECAICMSRFSNIMFMDCMHTSSCKGCADTLTGEQ